ncbi:hypothetical protein KIPB_007759 [Kipferlia bialata]|uniref:Uncharacterized protein n=1 Tax=Kipferlia bialata TaxID=797122 RepID=A0A9K3GK99_9EUKA|nr:hypothetical protein KIPB_007759 [Kipferlia bialata]|eukprot:g7759.t1
MDLRVVKIASLTHSRLLYCTGVMAEDEVVVGDFISVLEDHLRQCEADGKYYEADCARKRLVELRHDHVKRQADDMKRRHSVEVAQVEEAHRAELERFQEIWDQRQDEFDLKSDSMLDSMQQRQEADFLEQSGQIRSKARPPKFSVQLLNMRRIEQSLARQQKYQEAQEVQIRADILEEWERRKHEREENARFEAKEELVVQRHDQEVKVLKKKIKSGRLELLATRDKDIRKLQCRYKNVLAELHSQHGLERQKGKKGETSRPPLDTKRKGKTAKSTKGRKGGRPASLSTEPESLVAQYIQNTLSPSNSSAAASMTTLPFASPRKAKARGRSAQPSPYGQQLKSNQRPRKAKQ